MGFRSSYSLLSNSSATRSLEQNGPNPVSNGRMAPARRENAESGGAGLRDGPPMFGAHNNGRVGCVARHTSARAP